MNPTVNQKTKYTLERIVRKGLSTVLSKNLEKNCPLNRNEIATISSHLVDDLIIDKKFIECIRILSPDNHKELITTEDAARLSGFSRPVIIAILDGKVYPGKVSRTPKGHRRVERVEFVEWLKTVLVPKNLPKTIRDVRSGIQEDKSKNICPNESRKAQKVQRNIRLKAAKSIGIFEK
jgi:hypothetical protein